MASEDFIQLRLSSEFLMCVEEFFLVVNTLFDKFPMCSSLFSANHPLHELFVAHST